MQFGPDGLHHPVFPNCGNRRRSETGRFCGDSWRLFLSSRSLPTITAARVDFWPPVSVSKNSVPGGTVSSDTRPFGDLEIRNPERQKTYQPALANRLLRCKLRPASEPIADSIRAPRTAGSILEEHPEVVRLRCRGANGLRQPL